MSQELPTLEVGTSSRSKPSEIEVYECQLLSFGFGGKAREGKAKVRTGLGKSDRPGSQGGSEKRDHTDGERLWILKPRNGQHR